MALAYLVILICFVEPCEPAVSLRDLSRFPPAPVVASNRALATAHQQWVNQRWNEAVKGIWMPEVVAGNKVEAVLAVPPVAPADRVAWRLWHDDAEWREEAWAALETATQPERADANRLAALERVRSKIGQRSYARGEMPDPVPLQRYRWRE